MSKKHLDSKKLAQIALEIRKLVLKMVHKAASGHLGGPLGLADIFAVLYFDILDYNLKNSDEIDLNRDRLILSNGHVSAVRYATMKLAGFFPELDPLTFRKLGSPFQGHPSTRYLPELDNSGGSLGQGLSQAVGLALGARCQKKKYRVFACISDGECGEGMTWEAVTSAAHYKAPLIVFMDYNGIQIDGKTKDVCDLGDLRQKFESFGWDACEVDGHNISKIRSSFQNALEKLDKGPQIILFRTILGKGVSFMEDNYAWHGKAPNDEQFKQAMKELEGA